MGIDNNENQAPENVGSNCALCFPSGEAPLYVYAEIQGILLNPIYDGFFPPPPNGYYRLTNIGSCQWRLSHDGFLFQWLPASGGAQFDITYLPDIPCFADTAGSPCAEGFINEYGSSPSYFYGFGTVVVYARGYPLNLSWKQNFVPFDDAKNELWDLGDANLMQRIVREADHTNIIAKIETVND